MGMFDFLKKGKTGSADTVTPPSVVLRNAGIDPARLTFKFTADSVIIGGSAASAAERKKIVELVTAIPQVHRVVDQMQVGTAETAIDSATNAAPPTDPMPGEPVVTEPTHTGAGGSHTVVSGDTLWKIAEQHYGKGNAYMKIFEANRDQLDDPDQIKPGQVLKIPV
ncbi:MAG: LysM peptidoglycan-binding domain-containing protein [Gammaproteobacteria bacterium]|jgi:nucleoid-associated protein YgaU|nr:LysM peptidoglycan-binding domain-containing protein [Gammaproteobacteria bacterium]